jgi:hypothetical protein
MTKLRSIVKRWVPVCLLAVSLATPWTVLQSVAWFGMVLTYSQDNTLARALTMTFDGKHPCKLCHVIQQGQSEERQQSRKPLQVPEKIQLGLPPEIVLLFHPPVPARVVGTLLLPDPRTDPPPPPPPRLS